MRLDILLKTLRDRRRALIGWTVGMLGLVAMYVALWPTVEDQAADFQKLIDNYPDALKSMFGIEEITSAAGYLNTELFSFMAPLIFLIFTIGMATDVTAGEEQRKTMDLLMANPVTRTRVVLEKFGALVVSLAAIASVLVVSLWLGGLLVNMDIGIGYLVAAATDQFLLGAAFGGVALLIACLTGSRGFARGIAAGLAVAAFLLHSLAPLADWLEPYRELSPMYHAIGTEPLRNGLGIENVAFLVATAAAFLGGSLLAFSRRDLAT